ncbi:MAG: filamentous hemagglutinin N-terminal domain-containing protein, partial [Trichodesmium sp. ALOHA_ZT_67]|nr:filamentous hemagglutinin N-terminal domain-containing protein [Trichodesmium sp. ALOHA_ZT_67]
MLFFYKNLFLRIVPLSLTLGYFGVDISSAIAQLQPDNTLGEENSVVTPNINIKGIESDRIDGGAQRGANLFHSFQEFNIQQGRGVYFSNPDGVQNILTRVTGNNGSNILGTLGVDGKADLFFINPNGIIFGPEAKLDVQGSFYGATADSILFKNGFEFASSDPQAPPLLTVNVPIGLRLPENPGSILVEGQGHNISFNKDQFTYERGHRNQGLKVGLGQTLGLVGGDISLRGGNLTSIGGRVELGSVQSGVVGITDTANPLNYDEISVFGSIQLSSESSIDVSGEGAGEFKIQGGYIKVLDGSIILANTERSDHGATSILANTERSDHGATSSIRASESIELLETNTDGMVYSGITAQVEEGATGKGGDLTISAEESLTLRDTQISTETSGDGNAGNLKVSARNIKIIKMNASKVGLFTGHIIETEATGNGGDLTVKAESLTLEGSEITSAIFGKGGKSGNIMIYAKDIEIEIDYSGVYTTVAKGAVGDGGDITINAENLRLQNGGVLNARSRGKGNAGNITIYAKDIEIIGKSPDGIRKSNLTAESTNESTGAAGTITINTETLNLRNEAEITVKSATPKPAGDLEINSNNIRLENQARLTAETQAGDQGSITINNNKDLILRNNSSITTNAKGKATGGNI